MLSFLLVRALIWKVSKITFSFIDDFVIITAGLPFGKAGMTNMIRLYKVGTN